MVKYNWYVVKYNWCMVKYNWYMVKYNWYVVKYNWYMVKYCRYMVKYNWCMSFNRTQTRAVIGLLTGHNTLRRHLHVMGLSNDPACRKCGT
jgi:hypothetical protein